MSSPLAVRCARLAARAAGPAVILLAAVLALWMQHLRTVSCGHDFDFHLVSWLDAQHSWRQGVLYPRWTPSANFGAGEPRFVFYPPLTWMLGAALGFVMSWQRVPLALEYLMLAGTGLATRALARLLLTKIPATLAGCTAIFSGYTLFTAYERSAFGELAGGIWIPLLLLLILRRKDASAAQDTSLWQRALDGSAAPLALVVAGCWLSNAPLGVMACYLLAAMAIVLAAIEKSWAPVLRASVGALGGIGLAAVYLLPAAVEQAWADIHQVTQDPGEMIENSWLFARHADPALELHDIELMRVSLIGVTMIAVALGCLLVLWRRRILDKRGWIPLALIPPTVLLLQLPISLPIWNLLPKLRFLQFPWRWLLVVEAPMAVFFAATVWLPGRWRRVAGIAVCLCVFLGATVTAGLFFYQECDDEDSVRGMLAAYRSGNGFEGAYEYEPVGGDNSQLATGLPAACLVNDPLVVLGQGAEGTTPAWDSTQGSCIATYPFAEDRAGHRHIRVQIEHSGYLVLRLRRYPAWRITVNGHPAGSLPQRADGLMAVPVSQGPLDLRVDWKATPDAVAGRWLSAIAVLALTGLFVMERKLGRKLERKPEQRLDQPRLS